MASVYGVWSKDFKGVVHSAKEFREKVHGKKGTFGKKFKNAQEVEDWLENFESKRKNQAAIVYGVWGQDYTGVVHSTKEYKEKVHGKKGMHGKKFNNVQEAEKWIKAGSQKESKKKIQPIIEKTVIPDEALFIEPTANEKQGQTIIYIDGGYKNEVGTYGIVAYSSKNIEPIYKDFGYVYDQRFNDLKNTGAELMACLRALEWAFANNLKKVCIIYDYEGIVNHIDKSPLNEGTRLYQEMVTGFKKHMTIYFLHVRHSNKALHEEAHHLTQLAPI